MSSQPQGSFPQQQVWRTLNALLASQFAGADVQAISEKDFNEGGELIMNPPSLRTYYGGAKFSSTSDSQRLSYEAVGRFMVLVAEADYSAELVEQAYRSVGLADQVCVVLAGARLVLPAGDRSEPVTITDMDPLPVQGVGTAYAIAVEVPGLAQFPGANAAGFAAQGGQQ